MRSKDPIQQLHGRCDPGVYESILGAGDSVWCQGHG